ncbi:stellacyanin-like [Prunus avium]|uniref:Stellacyanin-like n=1 Tax=Prunus avium TaxID=42229 RepID=A0A6P5TEQ6_PRUAV|nr:stellacyanin-like [Prunus avium]
MARAIALLLIAFAIFPITALAKEYIVGVADGWNSEVDYYAWLDGKTFYVGDVLVFNYHRDEHNVLEVNSTGYDQCVASPNKGAHDSGNDKKTFKTHGNKYYICEWHCNYSGQKLKVPVLSKKL